MSYSRDNIHQIERMEKDQKNVDELRKMKLKQKMDYEAIARVNLVKENMDLKRTTEISYIEEPDSPWGNSYYEKELKKPLPDHPNLPIQENNELRNQNRRLSLEIRLLKTSMVKVKELLTKIDKVRPQLTAFLEEVKEKADLVYYGESFSEELEIAKKEVNKHIKDH